MRALVDRVDTVRRDGDFVKRQVERVRLAVEKFAANAVHGDAVVAFGDGGEKAATWNCFCWSSVCSAMALSLPPLQQKRMGSDVVKRISKWYGTCLEGARQCCTSSKKELSSYR